MKPQIVMQEVGRHNADLGASSARILKGGSWKKQRIIMILPAADLIPAKCALAWWNLIFPPNQGVLRMLALGQEVGEAYSNCIAQVISNPELAKWEYILTVEHDNVPPQDGILKLLEAIEEHPEFSCVGGLYWTKGEGGVPQIWGDPHDPVINYRPQIPVLNALQECCGTGMGFNLWKMGMFLDERLPRPWFKTKADAGGVGTQDLTFWSEARKLGYRCAIDNRVLVGHYDVGSDITW